MRYRLATTHHDYKEEILAFYPMVQNFDISTTEIKSCCGTKRNILFIELSSLDELANFQEELESDLIFLHNSDCVDIHTIEIYDD